MRSFFLGILLLILLSGCNQVRYVSITKPRIDTNTGNHYIVSEKPNKIEGNSGVVDINNRGKKYDTIVIEDDGTYYYTH